MWPLLIGVPLLVGFIYLLFGSSIMGPTRDTTAQVERPGKTTQPTTIPTPQPIVPERVPVPKSPN